jgi:hypothetical protein
MWPRLAILVGLLAGVATAALILGAILAFAPDPVPTPTPVPTFVPTPTPTPTPTPAVPPPGGGAPDSTPPTVSGLNVSGTGSGVRVRLTVSERSTVNVRFLGGDGEARMRAQVEQGTWTLDRALANGRYTYELWAVDAMGNRSSTEVGEVTIRG